MSYNNNSSVVDNTKLITKRLGVFIAEDLKNIRFPHLGKVIMITS